MRGLIVKEQSGFFRVEAEDGNYYTCRLRGRLLEEAQASDVAAIGDRVTIQILDNETGAIEAVEPRTSVISRAQRTEGSRGAGGPEREQVIVANAEQAVFVFAAAAPEPNLGLLDRFLVMGEKSEIERIIVVVNKTDLTDRSAIEAKFKAYADIGYTMLYTCALLGFGIDDLRAALKDKISVFTGPSGVGKTSLLNIIEPGLGRSVKAVSASRQEGLHTTRDSELVKLSFGGYLADTPGIRSLTVWGHRAGRTGRVFPRDRGAGDRMPLRELPTPERAGLRGTGSGGAGKDEQGALPELPEPARRTRSGVCFGLVMEQTAVTPISVNQLLEKRDKHHKDNYSHRIMEQTRRGQSYFGRCPNKAAFI